MKKKTPHAIIETHSPEELGHQRQVAFATRGFSNDGHTYTEAEKQTIYSAYATWAQENDRMAEYKRFMVIE